MFYRNGVYLRRWLIIITGSGLFDRLSRCISGLLIFVALNRAILFGSIYHEFMIDRFLHSLDVTVDLCCQDRINYSTNFIQIQSQFFAWNTSILLEPNEKTRFRMKSWQILLKNTLRTIFQHESWIFRDVFFQQICVILDCSGQDILILFGN